MRPFPTNPQRLIGPWTEGFALDLHTRSSEFVGHDEFGRPMFDTVRTEVGEALYKLKYSKDTAEVARLAMTAAAFVKGWKRELDAVVPVPPSKTRAIQPVRLVGAELARRLGIPFLAGAVKRTKDIPELKNVVDFGERQKLLAGGHRLGPGQLEGLTVLLFDDLFRSGATMNAVANTLLKRDGGVAKVFALTLTRTRSSR